MPAELPQDLDRLVQALADGECRSESELASILAWSAEHLESAVALLPSLGLRVEAGGDGLCLDAPVDLLDVQQLTGGLAPDARARLAGLQVMSITDSTSSRVRALPPPPPGRVLVCVAEYQTGGRGRRGRTWLSPYGRGLCMSVRRRFPSSGEPLAALALALGVAVQRVLASAGASGLGLKWPNDLVSPGGKLAGLLADVETGDQGADVTVGIGLNIRVDTELRRRVAEAGGQAPAGLDDLMTTRPSRTVLAALILDAAIDAMETFERLGFAAFADDWRALDVLFGREVNVQVGRQLLTGIARGIDPVGGLLLDVGGDLHTVMSGDVTVRSA